MIGGTFNKAIPQGLDEEDGGQGVLSSVRGASILPGVPHLEGWEVRAGSRGAPSGQYLNHRDYRWWAKLVLHDLAETIAAESSTILVIGLAL